MFVESTYINKRGQKQPVIYMNRDGFTLLTMGFTGEKALQFKLDYIAAFDKMEAYIRSQQEKLPQTPEERLSLTMEATKHIDKRLTNVEKDVKELKDNDEINTTQRSKLLYLRNKKVMKVVGGYHSNYYQANKHKNKAFQEFGHDFKEHFEIPRYDALTRKDYQAAIEFTYNWHPSFNLEQEIASYNAQTVLHLYGDGKHGKASDK